MKNNDAQRKISSTSTYSFPSALLAMTDESRRSVSHSLRALPMYCHTNLLTSRFMEICNREEACQINYQSASYSYLGKGKEKSWWEWVIIDVMVNSID